MSLTSRIQGRLKRIAKQVAESLPGAKGRAELQYWKAKKSEEGELRNDHYRFLYQTHFGLDDDFYRGKRILDIGCGPRGSLEWADMAAERVGLDPLTPEYLKLGAKDHKMSYSAAGVEAIPFPDGHFDVVCAFNSLDHVDNLDSAIAEITRVTAPGGLFLLLVEVNHEPTVCEPIAVDWSAVEKFYPAFEPVDVRHFERHEMMRDSLNSPFDHADPSDRMGVLSAKLRRVG